MRKTQTITIDAEGRDKGKVFKLTEMPAAQAERWAMRAFFALMNTGVNIPDGLEEAGLAGLASIGLQALGRVPYAQAEPLLAEMLDCVQIIPDPAKPNVVRKLFDEDIEEVKTRLELRRAVWSLHTDFFSPAAPSNLTAKTSKS
ncbi:MAG TPA: hypothetical protein VFL97_00705 [Nitrococcus sp.]|nr:hypothetical protein [Nitrococcus sp.]